MDKCVGGKKRRCGGGKENGDQGDMAADVIQRRNLEKSKGGTGKTRKRKKLKMGF